MAIYDENGSNDWLNEVVIMAVSKLSKSVLDKVVLDKEDILYAPSSPSALDIFNETTSAIIDNKIKNKLVVN